MGAYHGGLFGTRNEDVTFSATSICKYVKNSFLWVGVSGAWFKMKGPSCGSRLTREVKRLVLSKLRSPILRQWSVCFAAMPRHDVRKAVRLALTKAQRVSTSYIIANIDLHVYFYPYLNFCLDQMEERPWALDLDSVTAGAP